MGNPVLWGAGIRVVCVVLRDSHRAEDHVLPRCFAEAVAAVRCGATASRSRPSKSRGVRRSQDVIVASASGEAPRFWFIGSGEIVHPFPRWSSAASQLDGRPVRLQLMVRDTGRGGRSPDVRSRRRIQQSQCSGHGGAWWVGKRTRGVENAGWQDAQGAGSRLTCRRRCRRQRWTNEVARLRGWTQRSTWLTTPDQDRLPQLRVPLLVGGLW